MLPLPLDINCAKASMFHNDHRQETDKVNLTSVLPIKVIRHYTVQVNPVVMVHLIHLYIPSSVKPNTFSLCSPRPLSTTLINESALVAYFKFPTPTQTWRTPAIYLILTRTAIVESM